MSRLRMADSLFIAIVVSLLATPTIALADVLELHDGGATWIAGGPQRADYGATDYAAARTVTPETAELAAARVTELGITEVGLDAGPMQWRTRVGELAAKYDISPTLLEALVWQESRWNTGARSPVGARGLAQLMPGTARQLGVNPHDPSANLEGGARYLRMQLDTFGGDVEKALAAYNAGPGRVAKANGIPRIRETQDYVAAILGRLSASVRR